jgi:hypothetical protein
MDDVQRRFSEMRWAYAGGDPAALAQLESRLARVGRAGKLITYSDLVLGVPFDLPNLAESPRYIDIHAWQGPDRSIVGDFLAEISRRSYDKGNFLASALAVTAYDGTPGEGFHALLKELGLIPMQSSPLALDLWVEHVQKAHAWYKQHAGTGA